MKRLPAVLVTFLFSMLLAPGATWAQANADLDLNLYVCDVNGTNNNFLFSDAAKTNLKEYIYAVLDTKTKCCGSDAIYLEIKVTAEGTVESARSLTGRNDCLRRSAVDVVKAVKWSNPTKVAKALYLELKPAKPCTSAPGENVYAALNAPPVVADAAKPIEAKPAEVKPAEGKPADPKPAEAKPAEVAKPVSPKPTVVKPAETKPATAPSTKPKDVSKAPAPKQGETPVAGEFKLKQDLPKPKYVSTGDRKPDASHSKSHVNTSGPMLNAPEYIDGESLQAIFIKRSLRDGKVCGVVHCLAEVTVDTPGVVKAVRIFRANTQQVAEAMPAILSKLKYKKETVRFNQNIYVEFKADVDCPGMPAGKSKLNEVPGYLSPAAQAAPEPKPAEEKKKEGMPKN